MGKRSRAKSRMKCFDITLIPWKWQGSVLVGGESSDFAAWAKKHIDADITTGSNAEWLEPPVCAVAYRVLGDAQTAALKAVDGWQAAAKAVLINEETRLSPDSKLRPYFDAVISLL